MFGGDTHPFTLDTNDILSVGVGTIATTGVTIDTGLTHIYISTQNSDGATITSWLAALGDSTNTVKGSLRLVKRNDSSCFADMQITAISSALGYYDVSVTTITVGGSFADQDKVLLTFARAGDAGSTGSTGASGFSGYSGYSGRSGYSGYSGVGTSGFSGYSGYSGASGFSGYSGPNTVQCKYVTANQSTSSNTTLTNITDLVFTIGANETWKFDVALNLGNNVDVTGFKMGVTRPTGSSSSMSLYLWDRSSGSLLYGNSGATSVTFSVGSGLIPGPFSTCSGTVVVTAAGTSGTVQFQFAQETSDATNLTVNARSAISAIKVV
jgi:hypothetical protein